MGLINTDTLRKAAAIIKRAVDNEQLVGNDDETRNILANVKTIMTQYQPPVDDDDFDLPDLSYNEDAETARLIAESNANRARAMGKPVATYDLDAAPTIQMSADDVAKAHSRKNNNYTTAVKRKGSGGRSASTSATTARRRRSNTRTSTLTSASMRNRDNESKTGMYLVAVIMFFAIAITVYVMSGDDKKNTRSQYKSQTKSNKWDPHAAGPQVKKSNSKTVGGSATNPLANATTATTPAAATANTALQTPITTPAPAPVETVEKAPEPAKAPVAAAPAPVETPAAKPAPEPEPAKIEVAEPAKPAKPEPVAAKPAPAAPKPKAASAPKAATPAPVEEAKTSSKPKVSEAYLRRDKSKEKNYFNDDGSVVVEEAPAPAQATEETVPQNPLPPELQQKPAE